ncbi:MULTISPECIES: glycosyltransferase family 4 protein [unclassified Cyanobium]|uniref:glycosyltransferase family 4 protein n=1 Tax=unclassified Cyanobium TaxID=2627006 RepID=UPI0021BC74B0|nr:MULTISPECIES: glycosyltransferase family 4 protein [unclassified Cyanobium]MCP9833671.1 glycosyltransferase family 4 protein [Cyanobium sp. La Preciosa 7G6]MCP9936571.1 glycosyltransferase family 4 protein [Cyanobium sp. Aljojuca 7A6]
MTACVARMLEELDIEPVFAWYAPWSTHPKLSVPLHAVASGRRPGQMQRRVYGGHEGHGLGAWLPELEFTHYLPRRAWRELVAGCDLHLSVTGNPLCATPFTRLGIPFLAWVATPWQDDRVDRVKRFSRPRRLLDRTLNGPVLRRLERQVLQAPRGRILALSGYTATALAAIARRPMDGVMRMPVNPAIFHPAPERLVPWRIGFAGRYADPRKQITLLLEAVARLVAQGRPVQLVLAGEQGVHRLQGPLAAMGLEGRVRCYPCLGPSALAELLQGLDLFVIPSHQEGLCIAALEAMACGVPVVSTRCGGPEDYVIDACTGQLVASEPAAMAAAIAAICADRDLRERLSAGALAWVREQASPEAARRTFLAHLEA